MADTVRVRVETHPEFFDRLGLTLERRMTKTAMNMEETVVRSISIGQPVRRTRGGFLVGLNPSQPGEPPHVLYGRLRQSITHLVQRTARRIVARVGSNMVYARRLELGFIGRDSRGRNIHQAPRPYLMPALDQHLKDIVH